MMVGDGAKYQTPQEQFWAGSFGSEYIARNRSKQLLASNVAFFSTALRRAGALASCAELGASIGMNLRALKLLYPGVDCQAVEINPDAARELAELVGDDNVFSGSLADWKPRQPSDLALVKGVLIHLNPEMLPTAYDRLYA